MNSYMTMNKSNIAKRIFLQFLKQNHYYPIAFKNFYNIVDKKRPINNNFKIFNARALSADDEGLNPQCDRGFLEEYLNRMFGDTYSQIGFNLRYLTYRVFLDWTEYVKKNMDSIIQFYKNK